MDILLFAMLMSSSSVPAEVMRDIAAIQLKSVFDNVPFDVQLLEYDLESMTVNVLFDVSDTHEQIPARFLGSHYQPLRLDLDSLDGDHCVSTACAELSFQELTDVSAAGRNRLGGG